MEKMRHCKKGWKSIFHYTASCDVSFQMEDVPIIYLNHFESLYIWIIWRLLISQGRDRAQRHILSQINGKKNKRFCTSIHLISLLLIPFTENRYITPHFYILVINSKWKIFFCIKTLKYAKELKMINPEWKLKVIICGWLRPCKV